MDRFWKECIEKLEGFLKAHGADALGQLVVYRGPGYFLVSSAVCGLVCCFLCLQWHWGMGILGLTVGVLLPAGILYLSDERDNEIILKDLKWLYETISVQLQAGLHIQQALVESEGLMKNKRLRMALHDLTERLVGGESITSALNHFESSFCNRYISSFCVILRQMQDSGYGVKLLDDIGVQISEMERMQLSKKKETLEMQLQLFQMLLFTGILVMVLHGCILAALQNFNYL